MSERGFYQYAMERTTVQMIESHNGPNSLPPSMQNRLSPHIEEGKSVVVSIGYEHFQCLMEMLMRGLFIGLIVLFLEIFRFKIPIFRDHLNDILQLKPRGLRRHERMRKKFTIHKIQSY